MIKLKLIFESKYEVFRGDDASFSQFDPRFIGKKGYDTVGFWFTDNEDAATYYGQNVRKFSILIKNPLMVSSEQFSNKWPEGPSYWAKKAKNSGHDGVILHDIMDGDMYSTVYCVFTPEQISSV